MKRLKDLPDTFRKRINDLSVIFNVNATTILKFLNNHTEKEIKDMDYKKICRELRKLNR